MFSIGRDFKESARKIRAAASGTLPSGRPVVANTDGTVSVVASVAKSSGTAVNFTSNNAEETDMAYIGSNKIVIAYKDDSDSNKGKAVVGTISGTSLSFGTPVVFNNADTRLHVKLDSIGSNKVVIVFTDVGDSNHGTAIVGTVSGTAISFGSEVDFETDNDTIWPNVGSIGDNKVVIAWCKDTGSAANGIAVVGAVSGTSISFGAEVVFDAAGKYNAVASIGNSKVVIAYRDDGDSDKGKAIVGTVTGSVISFGTTVVYNNAGTSHVDVASIGSNKVVIAFTDTGNSNYGTAVVGTVSDTVISYGSEVVFESANAISRSTVSHIFENKVAITYRDSANSGEATTITGTVSGTAIAFTNLTVHATTKDHISAAAVGDNQIVVAYKQAGNSDAFFHQVAGTNLTSENFIGISEGDVVHNLVSQVIGTAATFLGSDARDPSIAYDTNSNRIVVVYQHFDGGRDGFAVVGTVASNTVSFGTPVEFSSDYDERDGDVIFDPDTNKVIISYGGGQDYGTCIVGTVDPSDNSISYGTAEVFNSAAINHSRLSYDTVNNKVVVAWNNNSEGSAAVGTVSGTDISFGTEANFNGNTAYAKPVYDVASGKTVVFYKDQAGSNYGNARVGTISGTDISFGTEASFAAASTTALTAVYEPDVQKIVVAFQDAANSNKGTYCCGTVSGTDISFSTEVVFNDAETTQIGAIYDTTSTRVIITYDGTGGAGVAQAGKLSGTTLTFEDEFTYESGECGFIKDPVYDPDNGQVIFVIRDDDDSTKGKAIPVTIGFDGSVRGSVATTNDAVIDTKGSINTNQDSLTPGQTYFVKTDGTLNTTADTPSVTAGTAVASNKIIVKG